MAAYENIKVVVASPSDLQVERDIIENVTQELNRSICRQFNIFIDIYRWETDTYPGFHPQGAQGLIDSLLPIDNCDLIIGIFWKRFGSPTKDAKSGTEHEIRRAYRAWKKSGKPHIMIYFNEKPYSPKNESELEQWKEVLRFREEFPKEGLWWTYNKGKVQFSNMIRDHITKYILNVKLNNIVHSDASNEVITWEDIDSAFQALTLKALQYKPDIIIGINRGGGIVGGYICKKIDHDRLYTIDVRENKNKTTVNMSGLPKISNGMKVLLVDDTYSTGKLLTSTVNALVKKYPQIELKTMVLLEWKRPKYYPNSDSETMVRPDYIGIVENGSKLLPWLPLR